ncbi:unnamed protein product [Caenorhabditis auriculariae]|uniref:C-CAP/cofactor C-like domain-containing protein n=1 Tax=Caenorhabditis auriculariae TaxID=2777116 RepID=A0A8S1HXX0_9PELO|nr:unnamed protein product [Caenorhabditis auriculariae]
MSLLPRKIGGDVHEIASKVSGVLSELQIFLDQVSERTKPTNEELEKMLAPLGSALDSVETFKSQNRRSQFYDHLSAVSEGVAAARWVTQNLPGPFVKDMAEASAYYLNRVLKEYKNKEEIHVIWAQLWKQLLGEMHEDVMQNHRTGISWNTKSKQKISTPSSTAVVNATVSASLPSDIQSLDSNLNPMVAKWKSSAVRIGGDVEKITNLATESIFAMREFLAFAAGREKPPSEKIAVAAAPVVAALYAVQAFKTDREKDTPFPDHLCAISDGISAVGWVLANPTPSTYVREIADIAKYFTNRVLKKYKDNDSTHVDWVHGWNCMVDCLLKYVTEYHPKGLVWNSSPSAQTSVVPPPPPPPPPVFEVANLDLSSARNSLFESINKGEEITTGLRKVTAEMQTHKNPSLRSSSDKDTKPHQKVAPLNLTGKKPSNLRLSEDNRRWLVEYFENDENIVVNVEDIKQTVYITECRNSFIRVNGKANGITLDGCKKTKIVFDGLISQCEAINCQSIEMETLGELPMVSIQKNRRLQGLSFGCG